MIGIAKTFPISRKQKFTKIYKNRLALDFIKIYFYHWIYKNKKEFFFLKSLPLVYGDESLVGTIHIHTIVIIKQRPNLVKREDNNKLI